MNIRRLVLGFLRKVLPAVVGQRSAAYEDPKYRAGQVWRYKHRPGDDGSEVVIGRVEKHRRGVPSQLSEKENADAIEDVVISVLIRGLSIRAPSPRMDVLEEISHLPVDRLALEASVTELIKEKEPLPASFEEGHQNWQLLLNRGAASWYKYPLSHCVELAARTFSSDREPRGPQSGNRKQ